VLSFLNRDAQLERLRQSVAAVDAEQDAETLDTVASIAFWGSLGAVVLVIVIEAALLSVLLRRRGGPGGRCW
jgi:hypothetical protein